MICKCIKSIGEYEVGQYYTMMARGEDMLIQGLAFEDDWRDHFVGIQDMDVIKILNNEDSIVNKLVKMAEHDRNIHIGIGRGYGRRGFIRVHYMPGGLDLETFHSAGNELEFLERVKSRIEGIKIKGGL